LRKIPDSQKQTKTLIEREGVLKLPQLWKKAKRCAAFSHSCLDKPSQKRARLIHSSNKPGGGSLIKLGTEEKVRTYSQTRLVFDSSRPLTQSCSLQRRFAPTSGRFAPESLDDFDRNAWPTSSEYAVR
jgi:hypothetical protein